MKPHAEHSLAPRALVASPKGMFLHFRLECLPTLAPGRRERSFSALVLVELVHQHAIGESAIGQKYVQHQFGHGSES